MGAFVRFLHNGAISSGRIEQDRVWTLPEEFWDLEAAAKPQNSPPEIKGEGIPLADVTLLAPVQPEKIVCVGLNYAKHVLELHPTAAVKEPVLFLKPPTAILGPEETIVRPGQSERVDYEGELGVVMGRTIYQAGEEQAAAAIFGFTCANDVTARDLQAHDGQWTRAKGFDTFCPVGPWVVTGLNPDSLNIKVTLNGQIKQSSNTKNMLYPVAKLVSFISQVMTLHPGDLILTGTPEGIGPMEQGDEVVVEIEGIGQLKNKVL